MIVFLGPGGASMKQLYKGCKDSCFSNVSLHVLSISWGRGRPVAIIGGVGEGDLESFKG